MNKAENITEEFLGAILGSIDEAIHAVNTKGITIFYNEVAARHDGLEIEEVIGKPILNIYPSLSEKSSTLLNVLKTRMPLYNKTQSFVNLHGKKIETVNTTLPIIVKGELIGAVEIAKDYSRLKELAERLVDIQKVLKQNTSKSPSHGAKYSFGDILTKNKSFIQTKEQAEKLAVSQSPIMVFGESGTGKELFVHAIHNASKRRNGPLIPQNCAAIPENLLEGILFGTSKGSFTGAVDRPGLFELADGGTLFLDELHAMPVELQAKLLRVLEDGAVRRIGSSKVISVDVRVISAMNINPLKAVEENKLREDLFYRLNVLTFEVTPLRERPEDILYLTEKFIGDFSRQLGKQEIRWNREVEGVFLNHSWPGNIRELKHTIEYMMNVCEGESLNTNDLPALLRKTEKRINVIQSDLSLKENLKRYEQGLIQRAMEESGGNIQKAARLLGIPRQTLQYKLKK
ncbi:sigma-54 interaction domain-containing protein [Mesobacillus foraminis]|uniref:Arginine utilization regulatory protein n=1 Tax=Mesobacillus foraminis TaxID=279826 RepID=A0A4R2B8Z7_9BACI|nr:sigma 54-interacting transcriptional regulator [Mesobacillus foraminis]TCN23161.1 arginine utilization regulatory protein [Mesobacillus foraminis]